MKRLLLKLLFPKTFKYGYYFLDGDKKKTFWMITPYEFNKNDNHSFAKAIDEFIQTKKPIYDEKTIQRIGFILNYKSEFVKQARSSYPIIDSEFITKSIKQKEAPIPDSNITPDDEMDVSRVKFKPLMTAEERVKKSIDTKEVEETLKKLFH